MKQFNRISLAALLCLALGNVPSLGQNSGPTPAEAGAGPTFAGFSKPESPTAHALIMAIGDYQGIVPKLKGVPFDIATATEIARRMGVPARNIRVLKDGELTLAGMRGALDDLDARLLGSDQVFIYYSGHGSRQLVREDGGERCAESLVAVDGVGFTDAELEVRLQRLAEKAQKTIVLIDACHSGGVTTRGVSGGAQYTAKSWTPPGKDCARPTNVLTRGLTASRSAGSGAANFVHIAAARDNEISFDQTGHGGVATQAWLACMAGEAKDTDGSGGISAEEIRACAQERINRRFGNVQGLLPHHVVINGNPSMVLSYAAKGAAAKPAIAPMPSSVAAPTVVATANPGPLAALKDIYNSRDDRRLVTLQAEKSTLRIGRDDINLTLTSREGGYVYLLMVGSDGQTFDLLFPNQLDRNNLIEAGATLRLPRPNWQLGAEGPPGKDSLLAIITDSPRDFGSAGPKPSGPFSVLDAMAAKDIQLVTAGAAKPATAECADQTSMRTLAVKKRCSTAYGAALLSVEEVR